MEKETVSLGIEAERLEALTFYLQKEKTSSLQKELMKIVEELYEKTVPTDVREYIEARARRAAPPKPKVKPPAKGKTEGHVERTDAKD